MRYVFATTWDMKNADGCVNCYEFDEKEGTLIPAGHFLEGVPIGTVFANKEKNVVYAIREERNPDGGYIYTVRPSDKGQWEIIGEARTFCPCTSYIGWAKGRDHAVVSNHSCPGNDAIVNLFALNGDGSVGTMLDKAYHTETSVLEKQTMSHPHCAVFSPKGDLCAVCDKGSDIVRMYKISGEKLEVAAKWKTGEGYSPRYAVFHPNRKFFYHNNETVGKVCAYTYDENNNFTFIGDFEATNGNHVEQQGLAIHPSGKYLYDIVRSDGNIVVFDINQESGALSVKQVFHVPYEWPRHIEIAPDGNFAFVSYHIGGKIAVYPLDCGKISEAVSEYDVPKAAGIAVL